MKKLVQDRESGLPDPLKNSDLGSSRLQRPTLSAGSLHLSLVAVAKMNSLATDAYLKIYEIPGNIGIANLPCIYCWTHLKPCRELNGFCWCKKKLCNATLQSVPC